MDVKKLIKDVFNKVNNWIDSHHLVILVAVAYLAMGGMILTGILNPNL